MFSVKAVNYGPNGFMIDGFCRVLYKVIKGSRASEAGSGLGNT